MWIHRTAILARIFDCSPKIFDDSVSTHVGISWSHGPGKAIKAGLRELTSTLRGKHFVVMMLTVSNAASPHLYWLCKQT